MISELSHRYGGTVDLVLACLMLTIGVIFIVGIIVFGWLFFEVISYAGSDGGFTDLATRLITDTRLHLAAFRTIALTLGSLTLQIILILGISTFLTTTTNRVKILLIGPALLSPSTLSVSWFLFLSPGIGPSRGIFDYFGIDSPAWFVDTSSMALLVLLLDTFQWLPFLVALTSFQLERIPNAFFEQADIEGASFFHQWSNIRLPALKPVLAAAVLVRFFDLIRLYDPIVVLFGRGGPAFSMETLSLYIHQLTFQPGQQSYAALIGLLFMMGLLVCLISAANHPVVRVYLPWNLRAQ